ncbi:hypothetical protein MXMO3_01164 [Maritalea myrionectae]|uniref:DUF1513 domain-containing protein n=1 Tax=Maritalea myrionectae TaxID=454601 RepID=A0A2R4MCN8_9HYPH|nr:DUF1513 domain-containing protein [Maritalea myrionectae]AVX03695.1 hypothetical protein MXMO3_01164 [Maritalea myrionectae]
MLRRDFLKISGASFLTSLALPAQEVLAQSEQIFASCVAFPNGQFGAVLLNERGKLISKIDLPARGHDIALSAQKDKLIVFARRPGTFAILFGKNGKVLGEISSIEGRHFYGHGAFSADDRLFYATENDFKNARGVIGIYDLTAQPIKRVGEFDAGGVGPHDLLLDPHSGHLIIANGGIETHPDFARAKLNLASMRANIAWINPSTGDLLARHDAPDQLQKLSLRHMALGGNGEVWIAGQYQNKSELPESLLAKASPDNGLDFILMPEDDLSALRNYIGSVATSGDGEQVAITSPKGGCAYILDRHGNIIDRRKQDDICGVDYGRDRFQFSSGLGAFGDRTLDDLRFDNHLIAL